MKLSSFLFFIIFLIFISACDRLDNRMLEVENNSDKTIYSIISSDNQIGTEGFYWEFEYDEKHIFTKEDSLFLFKFTPILPNEKIENHDRPRFWDSYFEGIEDKKLRLFIVTQDSVEKYGWHKIFKKNIYTKKYILSKEDLDKQNWTIIYK
jgi:hypothetical protein